jgi:hypothetical protein
LRIFGLFAKYGPAPSAEEIDENRAEIREFSTFRFLMIVTIADNYASPLRLLYWVIFPLPHTTTWYRDRVIMYAIP